MEMVKLSMDKELRDAATNVSLCEISLVGGCLLTACFAIERSWSGARCPGMSSLRPLGGVICVAVADCSDHAGHVLQDEVELKTTFKCSV
jgi:hypothetical protein